MRWEGGVCVCVTGGGVEEARHSARVPRHGGGEGRAAARAGPGEIMAEVAVADRRSDERQAWLR